MSTHRVKYRSIYYRVEVFTLLWKSRGRIFIHPPERTQIFLFLKFIGAFQSTNVLLYF